MPVKILTFDEIQSGKSTSSYGGQITLEDLTAMKKTFLAWSKGELATLPDGTPITTKLLWYTTKEQLDGLFNLDSDAELMEMTCAVHLSQRCICDDSPMKGEITVILETRKNRQETSEEGQFVLIPGYNDFPGAPEGQKAVPPNCCPSSKPPGA